MVYKHQSDYYATLQQADQSNCSTAFIEFILSLILETVQSYPESAVSDKFSSAEKMAYEKINHYLQDHEQISNQQAQQLLEKSAPTVRRYLHKFVTHGLLQAHGENKARVYQRTKS